VYRRTVGVSGPRDNDDTGDCSPLAEVDHPDGRLDVEVVQHGAAVNAGVDEVLRVRRVMSVDDGVVGV